MSHDTCKGTDLATQLSRILILSSEALPARGKRQRVPSDLHGWIDVIMILSFISLTVGFIMSHIKGLPVFSDAITTTSLVVLGLSYLVNFSLSAHKGGDLVRHRNEIIQEGLLSQAQSELSAIHRLSAFPSSMVSFAAERVKIEKEQLQAHCRIVTGSFDKLGLYPAIVPVAVALSKVSDESEAAIPWLYASAAVYLVSLAVSKILASIQRLEMQQWVLEKVASGKLSDIFVSTDLARPSDPDKANKTNKLPIDLPD